MNKFKIFSIALFAITTISKAQDIDQAKKAIGGEQYEKAKSMLKGILGSKESGEASFLLGNVYLKQSIEDSAKAIYQRGLSFKDNGILNNIGLGQIDLQDGNVSAAKAKFDLVTKAMKKRDFQQYVYVAQAYMNPEKPDYNSALDILNKAKEINGTDAQIQMALGDAYYGLKNQNEAYSAYRNAYTADSSLLRAKMQQGVLLKGARAFDKASESLNDVVKLDANYGPVYRELAETYYLWANNDAKNYTQYIQKALGYYEKYMTLTDYSLSSRMRHADFLILAKDYKALEVEANKMKELDNVNPRILRYLGYSAFQNGNNDAAITALNEFTSKGTNKIIAKDYLILGLAKVNKSLNIDGTVADASKFNSAVESIKKALEMDGTMTSDLNEMGKKMFSQKQYGSAASLFELALSNPDSKTYLEDNIYYGLCIYTLNRGKDLATMDKVAMEKADKAMDNVITASPTYQESYLYKARINSALENDAVMSDAYQKYVDIVVGKGTDEVNNNKSKVIEAYNSIGAFYANSDATKANDYFNKTLALDSANDYATKSIKLLKK